MTRKFEVTLDVPTEPAPDPDMTVFVNFMRQIKDGALSAEQANKLMDEIGVADKHRFWGVETIVNPKTGRFSTFYFTWRDGKWFNGTKEHQQEILDSIKEGK